jgi:uncharacterized protein YjbI with pentapeptide repeats
MNPHEPPGPWHSRKTRIRFTWLKPLIFVDWVLARLAYELSQTGLVKILGYASVATVIFAALSYITSIDARNEQRNYQAWLVASSGGGELGKSALERLHEDGNSLRGIVLQRRWFNGVKLPGADLRDSVLHDLDLSKANLEGADMRMCRLKHTSLRSANLRNANLGGSWLEKAYLGYADMSGAVLVVVKMKDANLFHTNLENADLAGADIENIIHWRKIDSLKNANIHGVKNAPEGFVAWAINTKGAVDHPSSNIDSIVARDETSSR